MSIAASNTMPSSQRPLAISGVTAVQILDSRGLPTIQVELSLDDGERVRASAPAGTSTGGREVAELRDRGRAFSGHGVRSAVAAVTGELATLLLSQQWETITELDEAMCALDGRPQLSRLGGNCLVAVSMAAARGFAHIHGVSLHSWIAQEIGASESMPVPYFNLLNGGAHAANSLSFQEFMIAPVGAASIEDAVQCGAEVYRSLSVGIRRAYSDTGFGEEGGFAPAITRPEAALDLLMEAIHAAGYKAGADSVAIALDAAANGFFDNETYQLEGVSMTADELIDYYHQLITTYPITSIEDGLAENDRRGWAKLRERLGNSIQIVGDDLFVTDSSRIKRGADEILANATVIKPNQAGTVSRTFNAIRTARDNGMSTMISHRSGETLDNFIADLAVGSGAGRIKAGAPARGERIAKYNRLIEIEVKSPGYLMVQRHSLLLVSLPPRRRLSPSQGRPGRSFYRGHRRSSL